MFNRHQILLDLTSLLSVTLPSVAFAQSSVGLTGVSYTVAKPVFARLILEFQKEWKAQTGQSVTSDWALFQTEDPQAANDVSVEYQASSTLPWKIPSCPVCLQWGMTEF